MTRTHKNLCFSLRVVRVRRIKRPRIGLHHGRASRRHAPGLSSFASIQDSFAISVCSANASTSVSSLAVRLASERPRTFLGHALVDAVAHTEGLPSLAEGMKVDRAAERVDALNVGPLEVAGAESRRESR